MLCERVLSKDGYFVSLCNTEGRPKRALLLRYLPIRFYGIRINNHDLLPYFTRETRRQIFHLIDRRKRDRIIELLHVQCGESFPIRDSISLQ